MNVPVTRLLPGTMGLCHGTGFAGELIRAATGSWAGHAVLYLGAGQIVQAQPPTASTAQASSHPETIWAWRMWDRLAAGGWTPAEVAAAEAKVVARGHALIGARYDEAAWAGFAAEVLGLRTEQQIGPAYAHDPWRVCSALVYDALTAGGVPLRFVPDDGPGLTADPGTKAVMPPNLVTPGMLLGLAQREEWT
jgi:cell wall-associated NlpC family hydrolase